MNSIRNQNLSRNSMPRLSCEGCTKRKVKCDRLIPCTNCRSAGILCVPIERRRLPRGRSRRCDNSLLQASSEQNDSSSSIAGLSSHGQPINLFPDPVSVQIETSQLSGHINNLSLIPDFCSQSISSETVLAHTEGLNTGREHEQLLSIYLTQVDPIVKILHRPSLEAYLLEAKCYLNYNPWHPAPTALASAIFYAASCTLDAETCFSCFGMDKASLISKYQKETQCALEKADYLLTHDFTVLQAFVISLIAMRCHDRTRRFWTMLALALRIAQALSLHEPHPPFPVSPFEREMRRRLWHTIGWLDMQASLNYVSEPMMSSPWLKFQPFLDIDDDELGTDFEIQTSTPRKVSETSLFHVMSYAQETTRYLNTQNSSLSPTEEIHRRQQLVLTFKERTDELCAGLQSDENDYHWYLKELTHFIISFLQLLALRPLQEHAVSESSHATNASILRLAVETLSSKQRIYNSMKTRSWWWIQNMFFPWHALAVALSEIVTCDDFSFVNRVWPLIEQSYLSFTTLENGSPSSHLQSSMRNLMERATRFHNAMLLFSVANESWEPSLPREIPLQSMPQRHATRYQDEPLVPRNDLTHMKDNQLSYDVSHQENDIETWIVERELDETDLNGLGLNTCLENTFDFSDNSILEALHDVAEQRVFLY